MNWSTVLIVAIGLVSPAISILKGRQAHDPPRKIVTDAIRQMGTFVCLSRCSCLLPLPAHGWCLAWLSFSSCGA